MNHSGTDELGAAVGEAFALIMDLAFAVGATPMNKHPACWEHRLGERWLIALNGHRTPMRTTTGCDVPPFHAYAERDGWPAALFTAVGGTIVGNTEDELIEALRNAVSHEQESDHEDV
jgi:hypothetical protein